MIALNEATSLETIAGYQRSLLDVLSDSMVSDSFSVGYSNDTVCRVCSLLQELLFTPSQMCAIEKIELHDVFTLEQE